MTQDLLVTNHLQGKSRAEVREILGEPDNINNAGQFEYQTDPGAWMGGANNGPWIHWLHVEFATPNSGVATAYITD